MSIHSKTLIVIAGPTAVGKTSVAIQVAKYFRTEIISADSRQCYRELKIGVARPSELELQQVKHHFIASHSVQDKVTAADFEQFAVAKLDEIFASNDLAFVTGGTGLYLKALCEGIDEIPAVPAGLRDEIISSYHEKGLQWLQDEIKKSDPEYFAAGEIKNPQRLMRALEVVRHTGRSILDFRKHEKAQRNFNIFKFALNIPKDQLHHNINTRVDQMVNMGLVDEVKSLLPYRHLNALQTVGYREIFDYLDNKISLTEAIELIKKNTRQYAKRQLTWFRKDPEYVWVPPEAASLIQEIERFLKSLRPDALNLDT